MKERFKDYAVKKQDFLGNEEQMKKVLQLIPDEDILLLYFCEAQKFVFFAIVVVYYMLLLSGIF